MSKWKESIDLGVIPVKLVLDKEALLYAVNIARDHDGLGPIPQSATLGVRVPSGGDYSGMDLEPDEIEILWETTP